MTVLEIGPSAVRCLPPCGASALDRDMLEQALAGIDDTTVLLGERPVSVESLWRNIISASVGVDGAPLTVVHPSWWPRRRITRILDVATSVVPGAVALPRSAVVSRHQACGDATVVELGDDVVAVCRGTAVPRLHRRPVDAAAIAVEAADGGDPTNGVLIDVPHGVRGGDEAGREIRNALLHNGSKASMVRIDDYVASPEVGPPATFPARRSRPWTPVAAAVVVGIVVCGVGAVTTRPAGVPAEASGAVTLVEGRVSVRIPSGWTVTRVTAGPGSRRVEIVSPADHSVALHLTQSYTPEATLDDAAQVLRHALAKEAPGTFVDFNPADSIAGRAAVTYREVRAGREVRWSVVVDGPSRISIGCQSAPGQQDSINPVCYDAIRSAREVGGTAQLP